MATPSPFNGWSDEIISSFCDAFSWFLCGLWRFGYWNCACKQILTISWKKNWRCFSMLLFTFFFLMLVSSSFSLWGARRDLGIGRLPQKLEGCHKTAQSLRTTRLSHICQAFLIGFEFQKNIFFHLNLGPSWSFNQYLPSIFDHFSICRKKCILISVLKLQYQPSVFD